MIIKDNETYPFPLEITLKPYVRSKSIHITRDKVVMVTVPPFIGEEGAYRFVDSKMDWIMSHLPRIPDRIVYKYEDGEIHYFLGKPYPVYFINGKKNEFSFGGKEIHITMTARTKNRKALYERLMKEELKEVILKLAKKWARTMDLWNFSFTIRKLKSRWGSCNTALREFTFALDLVTKPEEEIESVVVHEMNHLLEEGHNYRFYTLMEQWLPDYRKRRKKLNELPREFM